MHHYKSSQDVTGGLVDNGDNSTASARSRMDYDKDDLLLTHIRALWIKRAANFRRDKKAWCCTSILPSLFVLMGLLVFKFASSDPEFQPLKLSLDDYNEGISDSEIRNPVTVNSVSNTFECQPGFCAYSLGNTPLLYEQSNEFFTLCGLQAAVNPDIDTTLSCSLDEGTPFMQNIDEFGTEIVESNATGVSEVSLDLWLCKIYFRNM